MKEAVLLLLLAVTAVACYMWAATDQRAATNSAAYRSPFDAAFSPDGMSLAVSDRTAGMVAIIALSSGKVLHDIPLDGEPAGVAWTTRDSGLFVAESRAGTVAQIDAKAGRVMRRFPVGSRPMGLAVAPKRGMLLVANSATNDVSVVDLATGKERTRISVPREPFSIAITPDESLAVVSNLFPSGSAADPKVSAAVSLIGLRKPARVADVRLPPGSTLVRGVAISPDGRWAYAVHTVGRFALPTTQLERGWINTNALSVIDLAAKQHYATVLFDYPTEGAADPWGIAVTNDGKTLWATLAGVHQIAKVHLGDLHALLAGEKDPDKILNTKSSIPSIWQEIRKDPEKRALLVNDLAALYAAGLIERIPVSGKGPRGAKLAPDGKKLAVAAYYSGEVLLADPETGKITSTIPMTPAREPDQVRRGEMIFHDATYCFQHWLSCATCHPEGRVDGLNWDLLNDGIGNPKNTRSLLLSHQTPPVMSLGVRANMEIASLTGFRFILFREPEACDVEAVQAYIRSLRPERSPYLLTNGDLSTKAKRGKAIFESPRTKCASCHSGPLFTDLQLYDVGTAGEADKGAKFDTPTLIELWRTAPYLHSGEAATLHEVFTTFNKHDQHGATSHLSQEEIQALVEYLLSL